MTIKDARKQQRKSIKNRSLKERFSYFWEYFGMKTIAGIVAIVIVIAFIVTMVTKKEYAFTAVFFGGHAQPNATHYVKQYANSSGIDLSKYDVSVTCYPDIRMDQQVTQEIHDQMQTFASMVSTNSVECFAGHQDLFLYYAYMGYATDLRTVLTEQALAELGPYLHYIDNSLIEKQEQANGGLTDAYFQRQDSTCPELMDDPIPVGISLEAANAAFLENYHFCEDAVIGICVTSSHPKNALAFLKYCMNLI